MTDLTMCQDAGCPSKEQCRRFTSTPSSYRQSYFVYSPRDGDKCLAFVAGYITDPAKIRECFERDDL